MTAKEEFGLYLAKKQYEERDFEKYPVARHFYKKRQVFDTDEDFYDLLSKPGFVTIPAGYEYRPINLDLYREKKEEPQQRGSGLGWILGGIMGYLLGKGID